MRNFCYVIALAFSITQLLSAAHSHEASSVQQGSVNAEGVDSALLRAWEAVRADTAALLALINRTPTGPAALRSLLRVAGDSMRPPIVRLYAMWATEPFINPGHMCIRDSLRFMSSGCGGRSHPNYSHSTSIEPSRRDSARAELRRVEARSTGAVKLLADEVASYAGSGGEIDRVSDDAARICEARAATMPPAMRLDVRYVIHSRDFARIDRCTVNGHVVVAAGWRNVAAADSTLDVLIRHTADLSDQRIFDSLAVVIRDGSRPMPVRLAAIASAGTQLHPGMRWYPQRLKFERGATIMCAEWGMYSHDAVPQAGAFPLERARRNDGVRVLRSLATGDLSAQLRDELLFVAGCAEQLLFNRPIR